MSSIATNSDSIIDERRIARDLLTRSSRGPPAVKKAHVGAIMDSYNLTNGAAHVADKYLLTDVVRKGLGLRRHHDVRLGRNL